MVYKLMEAINNANSKKTFYMQLIIFNYSF